MSQTQIIKKGYKQTEIGVIPEDWEVKKISEIGTVIRGASPRPKGDKRYYGGNVPRLMVEDVTRDGKYVTPSIDFLTEEGKKRSRPCNAGTLTIVCSGTVGIPSFLSVDACIHDGFLGLVKIKSSYNDDYLYHQLVSFKQKLDGAATHGGIFTNLTTFGVREFQLPIPKSRTEQSAIASILSDTDALIENLDKLIEKKKAIKQGTMQELLTGKRRLPGFSGEWKTKKLGEICEIKKGQLITESTRIDGDIPVIAGGKSPAYYHIKANRKGKTITISGSGASAGYVAFHNYPIFASDCSTIEESSTYSLEFIYQYLQLQQAEIYKRQTGGAQPHIHPSDLKPIIIKLPTIENQQAIANILTKMDIEIDLLEKKKNKYQSTKQGMMQQLLTGNIRVYGNQ